MILKVLGEITHQRTEAHPRQCHGEGGHRHWAKVKDFRIDVERRQSLNPTKESFISINTAAVFSHETHQQPNDVANLPLR